MGEAATASSDAIPTPRAATSSKEATKPYLKKQRWYDIKTSSQIATALGWVVNENPCNLCDGYFKEPRIVSYFPHPGNIKTEFTSVTAQGTVTLTADGVSILRKNVVVIQPGRLINADIAYIYRDDKKKKITQIKLVGHVRLQEAGKLVIADRATLTFNPATITLINAAYHLYSEHPYSATLKGPFNAWGTARHAIREPSGNLQLQYATYSVCTPTDPTWQVRATRIMLDKQNEIGKAYHGTVYLKRLPVFYSPYYSFPLNHERKTGFLSPRLDYSNRSGVVFGFPFYWNMAPNYDTTITSRYLTSRGFNINAYFRYLSRQGSGYTYVDYLPHDSKFAQFRNDAITTYSNPQIYVQNFFAPYLNALQHEHKQRAFFSTSEATQSDSEKWSAHLYANYVTDPYYFQDFAGDIKVSSSTFVNQLLNRADLQYTGQHWQWMGMVQAYQTLHMINQAQNPGLDQYQRLPDFVANGYYPLGRYVDASLSGEWVNFSYQSAFTPDKPIGQRLHVRPGLSIPFYTNGNYIQPEIALDMTSYQVEHLQPGLAQAPTRLLPIVDIDSGLYFDRSFELGKREYTQTFEPRLFYLYVPFKNQNKFPNFDTVLLPFSFDQLFARNRFTGDDRLDNANRVSLGLTSRILNSEGGAIITGNLGTSYNIDLPQVCLTPDCPLPSQHWSPLNAGLSYALTDHWAMNAGLAYDLNLSQTDNAQLSLSYQHDTNHTMTLGYLFVHGNGTSIAPGLVSASNSLFSRDTREITFSWAWPVYKKWSMVGSWAYNAVYNRNDSIFAGLQYDTCCWTLQLVAQRSYIGSYVIAGGHIRNQFNNTYSFRFQLKGLADLGTVNVSKLLVSDIPGLIPQLQNY